MNSKIKKNSIALIIQVRNSSTRLPFKVMKNLCGEPMIVRILERVKRVKRVKKIVLATTNRKEDDIFLEIAKKNKVNYFRGSKNDLVDRYYQAAKKLNVSHVMRLPSDNAIPEPLEYDKIIAYHLKSKNDFSSNLVNFMGNGYPGGIGVEIDSRTVSITANGLWNPRPKASSKNLSIDLTWLFLNIILLTIIILL